jgi:carboxymethylenebutenolidase
MKCHALLAVFAALFTFDSSLPAQTATDPAQRLSASPRHHEWVDISASKGRTVHTFVVFPEVKEPATVVIVIHENRGLTDWVRGVADQLAEAGYIALAPDLLSGMAPRGGNTPDFGGDDKATQGIYKLPKEQVMADLDGVFKYAKEMPAGNKVVAVGGFCWGGGQSFNYAAHNPKLAAAFVFYGSALKDAGDYDKVAAPVYGFYGGQDARITGEVPAVAKRMKELGKKFDPVTYDGAGHGFMRQGEMSADAQNPNRQARDKAWERWKKLLSELKPAQVRRGTSAEVIRARVVPFSRANSVGTQMVLVDWRNTGTTTIRAVDADIIPFDARGRRLESGAMNKPIYAVSDSSPGIAPGETYVEPNGDGFILAPGFPKAARVKVTITEVVESGAY